MKKSLSLLLGTLVPCVLLTGACGDDVFDAGAGDADQDADARQDATPLPPPRDASQDGDAVADADGDADADADADGDAVADARADARDTGSPDADVPDGDAELPPDPAIATFVQALASAACDNYDRCCAGRVDPTLPADAPTCAQSAAVDTRFFGGLLNAYYYSPNVATRNKVRIDTALATACVEKINALGCIVDGIPGSDWKGVLQNCSGALTGVGAAGDTCYSDLECDRDNSCIGAIANGAPGVCTAMREVGEPHQNSAQFNGDSCSYRGYGFTPELTPGLRISRAAEGGSTVCLPQRALGERCQPFTALIDFDGFDQDCLSYACGFVGGGETGAVCVETKTDSFYCGQYQIP